MFRKIYAFGLLLLIAVVAAVTTVNWVLSPRPWEDAPRHFAQYAASTLEIYEQPRESIQGRLDELARMINADVAIYEPDGRLFAFAGSRAPAPLRPHEVASLSNHNVFARRHGPLFAAELDGGAYLIVKHQREHGGPKFWLVLLAVFFVLGAVSWPFARMIVRPLERLTDTARRLGDGDLTARTGVKRKDELGVLAAALDDTAERLQRLMASERELLANVSHELRTPLARIRVCLELADEETDAEVLAGRLKTVQSDLVELETLLDTVLTTARLDSANGGALPFERAPANLAEVVRDATKRFEELHPTRQLRSKLPGDVVVDVDASMIRRVVVNLLDNAAKYSEESAQIELEAGRENGAAWVEIRDRGDGVEDAELERMFEPFFRADRSRSRQTGGVGLGLSLCRRIVEGHGGEIHAIRRDPAGLTVRFEIPVKEGRESSVAGSTP